MIGIYLDKDGAPHSCDTSLLRNIFVLIFEKKSKNQIFIAPFAKCQEISFAHSVPHQFVFSFQVYDMGLYQEKIRAYGILPAHRNVAGIRDIILGERKAYVFLEKDFGDMHTLVKSCRRLNEEQACTVFQQVAQAVAHCHQAGVVLGDLKLRKFVFADEKR